MLPNIAKVKVIKDVIDITTKLTLEESLEILNSSISELEVATPYYVDELVKPIRRQLDDVKSTSYDNHQEIIMYLQNIQARLTIIEKKLIK